VACGGVIVIGKNAKKTTKHERNKEMKTEKNIKVPPTEKVHYKQQEFFKDNSRNRWIFGGNRTGKTYAGAAEAVRFATENKTDGWVISLSAQVQRDVCQRKILELLAQKGVHFDCVMTSGSQKFPERGVIDFINLENGSKIGFKNCEQGREKFQGTALDWVWFDEEPPQEIYEECLMRTLDKGGFIWGTMTPLKGKTWLYDRIFKVGKPEISIHRWSWQDNPYLCPKAVKQMEKMYNCETLESRKFGNFSDTQDRVYREFSDQNVIRRNDEFCPFLKGFSHFFGNDSSKKNIQWYTGCKRESQVAFTGISIDPGYTNPTGILWFAVDTEQNIFVIDEFKKSFMSVEQIANVIYQKSEKLGVPVKNVFIDSQATARNFGEVASVADQFRKHKVPVDAKVDKNILEGVHKVKNIILSSSNGIRKLFVLEHCVELLKEIQNYVWGENERPIKKDDHLVDALRYFVMTLSEAKWHIERNGAKRCSEDMSNRFHAQLEKHKRRILKNGIY